MVNNSTNINKMNNYPSPQIIEHASFQYEQKFPIGF
jgi:hypothetical protein